MKGSQIAGLIIGLIIIIVAIIVIVILLKKRNKSTKSQEIVIDNGKVQGFVDFSKANLGRIFKAAQTKEISEETLDKARSLYDEVPASALEVMFERNIPYHYIENIRKFNDDVAKYFPEDRKQPGWIKTPYKKDNKDGETETTEILVPKTFSYVLYDTLNGDLKKVYINPPINTKTNEKEDYDKYDTLGDFLIWHIGKNGTKEVVNEYIKFKKPDGSLDDHRKVDIDLNDERLVKLSQLKDIYDNFVSSDFDNFDEYLYRNQTDIGTRDEARERAEAIIEVLTTSPYTWVTQAMIDKWNGTDVSSIDNRKQYKHPVIYAMSAYL